MKQNNGCPKFKKLSEFICTSVLNGVVLQTIVSLKHADKWAARNKQVTYLDLSKFPSGF